MSFPSYLAANWDTLGPQIVNHLEIVIIVIALAGTLGIASGIIAARSPRFSTAAIALTSAILTIPSFALFGALAIWLGIGNLPVEAGLILYALLPILRNTETGLRGVDPAIVEAARGMGMGTTQVLTRIELPLALPLIVAGLRQASVLVVAIATVGAAVGSNNLGQPILAGIRGSDRFAILSGVLPVACVGILADLGLGTLARALGLGGDGQRRMISLEHVSKRYGETVAVDDVSLEIGDGEIAILVGPSGCGKTTTLKMINRLIEPTAGTIRIDGRLTSEQDVNALRRSIGYVIQQVGLFPHMTIADNVATVPRLLGWDRTRISQRVNELLELVGLPPDRYAKRLPNELSGGQRQRVGVARALGADPPVLLMDEPFGAIDPVTRDRLQDELLRLQSVVRKTIVFVTHDIGEAIKLGDRIALFSDRAQIAQYATPMELLASPASAYVEGFLGDDRLVRRLGLIQLRGTALPPSNGARPSSSVSVDATLREALDAVLGASDGRVAVMDGEQIVGVVDAEAIRQAAL